MNGKVKDLCFFFFTAVASAIDVGPIILACDFGTLVNKDQL